MRPSRSTYPQVPQDDIKSVWSINKIAGANLIQANKTNSANPPGRIARAESLLFRPDTLASRPSRRITIPPGQISYSTPRNYCFSPAEFILLFNPDELIIPPGWIIIPPGRIAHHSTQAE